MEDFTFECLKDLKKFGITINNAAFPGKEHLSGSAMSFLMENGCTAQQVNSVSAYKVFMAFLSDDCASVIREYHEKIKEYSSLIYKAEDLLKRKEKEIKRFNKAVQDARKQAEQLESLSDGSISGDRARTAVAMFNMIMQTADDYIHSGWNVLYAHDIVCAYLTGQNVELNEQATQAISVALKERNTRLFNSLDNLEINQDDKWPIIV